ncbi:hypothetical protein R6Z07F_000555 [Ovis aries]
MVGGADYHFPKSNKWFCFRSFAAICERLSTVMAQRSDPGTSFLRLESMRNWNFGTSSDPLHPSGSSGSTD